MLVHLDVSRNELWDIPSTTITSLPNVTRLNISRNWFTELPTGIGQLTKLQKLNASHNMLRSSQSALLLLPPPLLSSSSTIITSSDNKKNNTNTTSYATKKDDVDSDRDNDKEETTSILRSLKNLVELDLTFNQKCSHQKTKDKVAKELYNYNNNNNNNHNHSCCTLKMTINFPPPSPLSGGANNITDFIGSSAAVRDPGLLRSQLECWSTTALRRRLVADFGEVPTNPSSVSRGTVMEKLLALYAKEEQEQEIQRHCQPQDRNDNNNNHDKVRGLRKIVYADGRVVQDESLRNELLVALMGWKASWTETNNERASINANNYMILTSPESWDGAGLGRKKKWKGLFSFFSFVFVLFCQFFINCHFCFFLSSCLVFISWIQSTTEIKKISNHMESCQEYATWYRRKFCSTVYSISCYTQLYWFTAYRSSECMSILWYIVR